MAPTAKIECGYRARRWGFASETGRHLHHGATGPISFTYELEFRGDLSRSAAAISGVARACENPPGVRLPVANPGSHCAVSGHARILGYALRRHRSGLSKNRLLAYLPSRCLRSQHLLYGGIYGHRGRIDRVRGLRVSASCAALATCPSLNASPRCE